MRPIRLIKKDERETQDCVILPPDVAAAVREIVREEHERLRREETFRKLRAMKSKVADMERQMTAK